MKSAAHRVESLDVFRGVTIAAMILVNNPGDWNAVYPQLLHAYWIGCTFADVVFPWFIFIMGFAMPFAFARRREQGAARVHLYRRIVRRVAWLTVLGLVLNAIAAWPAVFPLRFPGVLQRIAWSYLIASVIVLRLDVSGWIVALVSLLVAHWALLALVPFGGYPGGTLTPEHNLARYVDTLVLGRHALNIPNDPEGLIGTLSAAATALIGACAGHLVRRGSTDAARVRTLVIAGSATFVVGLIWSRVLPISKPLWTGSFVLVVCGLAMLAFGITYLVVDMYRLRTWVSPFLWMGVNPLAMYFLSEAVGHLLEGAWVHQGNGRTTPKAWLFWGVLEPALHPHSLERLSLAFGVAFVSLWIAVAGVFYYRRIRIQV